MLKSKDEHRREQPFLLSGEIKNLAHVENSNRATFAAVHLMPSSATTTAIPLANISQQQTANNATLLGVNSNAPSTSITRPTASASQQMTPTNLMSSSAPASSALINANATNNNTTQPPLLPRYANGPLTWSEKFANSLSWANGLGTMALIAAVVFGIGAWVGMKVQISQGGQSMELAIWTTCADHEIIQNSTLCKSIMAKDFSELATRELTTKETTVVVKRDLNSNGLSDISQTSSVEETHYSKLVSSLSSFDRSLIESKDHDFHDGGYYQADPAIRATIFPLVQLLIRPLQWIFDFIESILLLIVFCVHKLFSWMTWIFIFVFQATLYGWIEQLLKGLLTAVDQAIWEIMPSWMPYLLASNIASWIGLSALRSFWYGTSFLQSLKWIFLFRLGMWCVVEAFKAGYHLWANWNDIVERRRRMQNQWRLALDRRVVEGE